MLRRRKKKTSIWGLLHIQRLVGRCLLRSLTEVIQSRSECFLHVLSPTCIRWTRRLNSWSCALWILAFFTTHFVMTSTALLTTPQTLNLGILVAESCDAALNAKIDKLVAQAFQDVSVRIQQESGSAVTPLGFSYNLQSHCHLRDVVKNLDDIFGNASSHAILVLASSDLHASLVTMSDIYTKAYISLNSNLLVPSEGLALSLAPSYIQQAMIMSKLLDTYQWQTVHVIHANFKSFSEFAIYFYLRMTFYKFNVTLGNPVKSPVNASDAIPPLKEVGSSKVVLLLMDLADQLTFLAVASSLAMTRDHAFFTFTKTPYDVTYMSLVGLKADVTSQPQFFNDSSSDKVNIFSSVFVIAPSFPADSSRNSTPVFRRKRHLVEKAIPFPETPSSRQFEKQTTSLKFVSETLRQKRIRTISRTPSGETRPCVNSRSGEKMFNIETDTEHSVISRTFHSELRPTVSSSNSKNSPAYLPSVQTEVKSAFSSFVLARNTAPTQGRHDLDFFSVQSVDLQNKNNNFPPRTTTETLQRNIEAATKAKVDEDADSLIFASEEHIFGNSLLGHRLLASESSFKLRIKRDLESFKPSDLDVKAVYDVVYAVAYSVYKHLETSVTTEIPQGQTLIQAVRNISFSGNSGEFIIDKDASVHYDFIVYDFNEKSKVLERRIFYTATSPFDWTFESMGEISWPEEIILEPDLCFKQLPNCNDGLKVPYIAAIVISAIVLVVVGIAAAFIFRRYWLNKEMTKGPNKVILNSEDLVFVLRKDMGKGSRILKSRATLLEKDNAPDLIRGSDPNRSMASINELSDYTETARYNGDLVHVKELDIKGFEMRSKLLTYIRMCRDLRHENLNPYVGFLADPLRPSIVMEYCSRGSLNDIIHNDDFKLDWDFKLSLLTDLVRGVRYLHSSALKFHGHITSKNCVIDSRFVLKITDYGISGIMERCKATLEFETRDLLWSAPELLRDLVLLQKGSEKGDLYAIAIIFQEVILRSEPYSTTGLTPEEIVKKLKKPPPLIRPSVTPQAAPPQFIQIMKQCWSEMPEMRPGIDEVYDQFKKLTGGKKANIVDTMFKMLEKYSTDLEDIVAERTMQLEEEKKKTDQLLFRMLPPTVAESLKMGRNVEAECFDEVTIYFSDIVGFTTISAMSTPMQVVDLLNDLYTMFDATINDHDVYKVETIGDAYMVVSGLPIRNGNRHAGEIGTLALVLLSQCGKFTIRHMPQVPLRLRIGLHTGSCVAGVVGLTMPRFCLFGDTVNTASRMESTGAAFRIHISETCKLALDVLGGYITEYRGQTELKGKGLHNTYWLVGKEGFDKELPEPPPVTGDTTHGLDSILGDIKLENMLNVTPHETLAKSISAPNFNNKCDIEHLDSHCQPSSGGCSSSSQATNVHDDHHRGAPNHHTSVVKADINITGRAPRNDSASDTLVEMTSDAEPPTASVLKNKHSESNDSGFGSERKHSHGNDSFSPAPQGGVASAGFIGVDKLRRTKTSVVSSSDVSLHTNYSMLVDLTDELTPVTEV